MEPLADDLVEVFDGFEIGVGERLVDKRPKMLGGLQLGAMGRLENEPDAFRHDQVFRAVPAGVVELKHRPFVLADADRFGEVREDGLEHFLAHGVRDIPYRAAGGRLDEAVDVL